MAFATDFESPAQLSPDSQVQDSSNAPHKRLDPSGNPVDIKDRDDQLETFYNDVIPLLLSWQIAKQKPFNFLKSGNNYNIPEWLLTPWPHLPYREPGIERLFLFPGNIQQWNDVIAVLKHRKTLHERLIKDCHELMTEMEKKDSIGIMDEEDLLQTYPGLKPFFPEGSQSLQDMTLIKSLLTKPQAYTEQSFKLYQVSQNSLTKVLNDPSLVSFKKITIPQRLKDNLGKFTSYHEDQLGKIDQLLSLMDTPSMDPQMFLSKLPGLMARIRAKQPLLPEQLPIKELLDALKPFFLSGSKSAHDIIKIKPIQEIATFKGGEQGKSGRNLEIVVLDDVHTYSRHLSYSPLTTQSHFPEEEKKQASSQEALETPSHSTAVSGIIGAHADLEQLKGVAPGAKILPIQQITPGTLEIIKKSKARVINISQGFALPLTCKTYFDSLHSHPSTTTTTSLSKRSQVTRDEAPLSESDECELLEKFIQLVEDKDMIIVQSSGNEGVQLKAIDWETGAPLEGIENARGLQYERDVNSEFNGKTVDFSYISRQIPPLKNRLILVGNLRADGVTVAPSSSLPGAFANDFIYAPSEDIATLHSGIIKYPDENHDQYYYGEIGSFSGTSGAAPRVSGVIALLGYIFPDLPMSEIRTCVLESGDPFWQERSNKFGELKSTCGEFDKSGCTDPYGQRLYGHGRINAKAAYDLCLQKNDHKQDGERSVGKRRVDVGLSVDSFHAPQKDPTPPFYQVISSTYAPAPDILAELLAEIRTYYSDHPQTSLVSPTLGLSSPLRIALDYEETFPGLISTLLESPHKPQISKVETQDIMQKALMKKKLPLSLFSYLLFDKKTQIKDYNHANTKALLVKAVREKSYDLAKTLIELGSDPNTKDEPNSTNLIDITLSNIQGEKDEDFATFLIKKGIVVSLATNTARHNPNPLCRAIRDKKSLTVKFLVHHFDVPSDLKCIYSAGPGPSVMSLDNYMKKYPDAKVQSLIAQSLKAQELLSQLNQEGMTLPEGIKGALMNLLEKDPDLSPDAAKAALSAPMEKE